MNKMNADIAFSFDALTGALTVKYMSTPSSASVGTRYNGSILRFVISVKKMFMQIVFSSREVLNIGKAETSRPKEASGAFV